MSRLFFYCRNTVFGFTEEWSSWTNALAQCLLYPFFVWLFARLWLNLSGSPTFSFDQLLIYVGLTNIIFLTSLRGPLIDIAVANFSLNLAKPRLWLIYNGTLLFGQQLGRRFILLIIFLVLIAALSGNTHLTLASAARFSIFLPILTLIEMLYSIIFVCMQIYVTEIKYFRLALTKLLMLFGGVFTPLSDLNPHWQSILLHTPLADLIFQPCYYSLRGSFYQLDTTTWIAQIVMQIIICSLIAFISFYFAKRHFQCYGG